MQDSFGKALGQLADAGPAPSLVSLPKAGAIAVTKIASDRPNSDRTPETPPEDALMACVSLYPGFTRELWLDGRPRPRAAPLARGIVSVVDLRHQLSVKSSTPYDIVQFYFSRAALETIGLEDERRAVDGLSRPAAVPTDDDIFYRLAEVLTPALQRPGEVNGLFLDSVTRAAGAHVLDQYCGAARAPVRLVSGGLAGWQERRVRDHLASTLCGAVSLADLARECRLSPGHFAQAFAKTFGMPPHRWLLHQRVERAKSLLSAGRLAMDEVAREAGFSSQSHLARTFGALVGEAPTAWRRRRTVFA